MLDYNGIVTAPPDLWRKTIQTMKQQQQPAPKLRQKTAIYPESKQNVTGFKTPINTKGVIFLLFPAGHLPV